MRPSLIICPVGNPITFDSRYNAKEHWRYIDDGRDYETLVFKYSDFMPELRTYDMLDSRSGFKWNLSKELLRTFDYSEYEYIGFLDDDLITDKENINRAIKTAYWHGINAFQLPVTHDSDMHWPLLKQKPNVQVAYTNFIEIMGPFIHTSKIPLCMELWEKYDIYSGWGFDKVLSDLLNEPLGVMHCSSMYHPKKESSYDKSAAFKEMDHLLYEVFPKFMKDKYNKDWTFKEEQKDIKLKLETA